jgi:putative phosphonate metabolism protein
MSRRYAIYFAPSEASPLWAAGSQWLGRDAARGAELVQPAIPGVSTERLRILTRAPARYGFHATLKAPFRLAENEAPARLFDALSAFAGGRRGFALPALQVDSLSGFLALVPTTRSEALHALADDCVTAFDRFRRPAQADELVRRRSAGLNERQDALLARFGYPFVLDEFRFHMTLTEQLQPHDSAILKPWLEQYFAAPLRDPSGVTDLCLFVQERPDAPFSILQRFSLTLR